MYGLRTRVDAAQCAIHALAGIPRPSLLAKAPVAVTHAVQWSAAQLTVVAVAQEVRALTVLASDHLRIIIRMVGHSLFSIY